MYVYIGMYLCMYIYMYVCKYVCIYVCMYVLGGGSKWATPQAVLGGEGSSFKQQRVFWLFDS